MPAAPAPAIAVGIPTVAPAAEPVEVPVGRQRPLRKLTPEEKSQRRLRRNIIMAAAGIAILMIVMSLLLKLSG
jgi:hypothetical protein